MEVGSDMLLRDDLPPKPGGAGDVAISLFEAAAAGRLWEALPHEVGTLLGDAPDILVRYDGAPQTPTYLHSVEPDLATCQCLDQLLRADLGMVEKLGFEPGRVLARHLDTNCDLCGRRGADKLGPPADWHCLWAKLEVTAGTTAVLAVAFGPANSPPPRAAQRLEAFLPQLNLALSFQAAQRQSSLLQHAALAALDRMPIGVALTDAEAKVLATNAAARSMIEARDGLALTNGQLSATINGAGSKLRKLIGAVAAGTHRGFANLSLPRRGARHPLSVTIAQVGRTGLPGSTAANGGHSTSTVVYVTDPDRPIEPDQDSLRTTYGLTAAEARLASRIATGESLADVAAALDISYNTARTHLRRIFGKTQTERQGELVSLLLSASIHPNHTA